MTLADDGANPAELEARANAAYAAGSYEDAVAAWEQLHALHRGSGESVPAARAAVMTAMLLLVDAGLLSAVRGWVRRAQRLLAGQDDTPVQALIEGVLTYERFFSGDMDASRRHAARAIELGEAFDVVPAVAIGLTATGRITVLEGDVEQGLAQLDEVAALLMSGEVDDMTTGIMFCELVCAAQSLLRTDLAREWTDMMQRWGATAAFGAVRGRCRVHRAELLRHTGPGDAAEREALQACAELRPWLRREYGWPLVELGLTRLRRGDLTGAEEAFNEAQQHRWPAHPGLAMLRLEAGDIEGAGREIESAIAHPIDAPSKELPPFGGLRLAPLFDAQSEIALARGDVDAAGRAAAGLARVAGEYGSPALVAAADLAAARQALLTNDVVSALDRASAAAATFVALDALFDVARARVVTADAHAQAGSEAAARAALTAARTEYARYGAAHRVAAIDARLGRRQQRGATAAKSTHRAGLHRDGPMWSIELGGEVALVKDLKGLRYIRRMLAEPGREFHVLDLMAVESGTLRASGSETQGIPILDEAARDAYRRRLADIDDDIDEATRLNDLGRLARAEMDRDYLVDELTRGLGIGNRIRTAGGSSERARTAVARSLRYTLDEVAAHHPAAADHLRASLRTGTYCAYAPDPLATVAWDLGS